MQKLVLILALALGMSACAQLLALTESAAERAGKGIAEYCKLPAESRLQFRELVAKHAAPHAAQINCAAPGS